MQSPEKTNRYAMLSYISAILFIVLPPCSHFTFLYVIGAFRWNIPITAFLFFDSVAIILPAVAGITLGILALRKGDPQQNFAVAGIILNVLLLVLWCLFFIFFAYIVLHFDAVAGVIFVLPLV